MRPLDSSNGSDIIAVFIYNNGLFAVLKGRYSPTAGKETIEMVVTDGPLIRKHWRLANPIGLAMHLFQNPFRDTLPGQKHSVGTGAGKRSVHWFGAAISKERDSKEGPLQLCGVMRSHKGAQPLKLVKGGSTNNLNDDNRRFPFQSTLILCCSIRTSAEYHSPLVLVGDQKWEDYLHGVGNRLYKRLVVSLEERRKMPLLGQGATYRAF